MILHDESAICVSVTELNSAHCKQSEAHQALLMWPQSSLDWLSISRWHVYCGIKFHKLLPLHFVCWSLRDNSIFSTNTSLTSSAASQSGVMQNIWSMCGKFLADLKCCSGRVDWKRGNDKVLINISVTSACLSCFSWDRFLEQLGHLPFRRVVEGMGLPESRFEEMRTARISKYPI